MQPGRKQIDALLEIPGPCKPAGSTERPQIEPYSAASGYLLRVGYGIAERRHTALSGAVRAYPAPPLLAVDAECRDERGIDTGMYLAGIGFLARPGDHASA
jgi:hypothetical protein